MPIVLCEFVPYQRFVEHFLKPLGVILRLLCVTDVEATDPACPYYHRCSEKLALWSLYEPLAQGGLGKKAARSQREGPSLIHTLVIVLRLRCLMIPDGQGTLGNLFGVGPVGELPIIDLKAELDGVALRKRLSASGEFIQGSANIVAALSI